MTPRRIQLSRKKGWKMPPNTVKVDRATPWGNPFKMVGGPSHPAYLSREDTVRLFRTWMTKPGHVGHDEWVACVRRDLKGKNLACWCAVWRCNNGHTFGHEIKQGRTPKYCPTCSAPLARVPCHADVLLEIANA